MLSLACANKVFLHRQTGRTLTATALDDTLAKTEDVPLWAKGVETEKKLFKGLNLDGIGDSDDEAYISIYQFGDYEEDRITVMRIHLGTGETIAKMQEIEKACEYMTAHFTERIYLDQICRHAGLSKSTLLRALTKEKGVTPYRYLETIRINEAKKLLSEGVPPVEAAIRTGFSDQSHFTNYFNQFIGLAPGTYREIFSEKDGTVGSMGNRRSAGHSAPRFIGCLAALFTIIIWGMTFISAKVLLTDFRPVEILFFRFVMGFAALFLVCPTV